jgi:hypothetical protein
MVNVESKDLPGASEALVQKYGADKLPYIFHPRGLPNLWLYWDRSDARDGSSIAGPVPATQFSYYKRKGWIAIRLVEEHMAPDGGKWRELDSLPDELFIAGEVVSGGK